MEWGRGGICCYSMDHLHCAVHFPALRQTFPADPKVEVSSPAHSVTQGQFPYKPQHFILSIPEMGFLSNPVHLEGPFCLTNSSQVYDKVFPTFPELTRKSQLPDFLPRTPQLLKNLCFFHFSESLFLAK